jgi:hypothetical protein
MKGLRDIIRELLQEDDEAAQKGWKHIAFGTYEDPSGNRFRKDSAGNWQPVGGEESGAGAPAEAPPVNKNTEFMKRLASPGFINHPTRSHPSIPRHRSGGIAPAMQDSRTMRKITTAKLYGGNKPMVSFTDDEYRIKWTAASAGSKNDRPADPDTTLTLIFPLTGRGDLTPRSNDFIVKAGDEVVKGRGSAADAVRAASEMGKKLESRLQSAASSGDKMADYEKRVRELEDEGLDTSDAQGVADAEYMKKYGRGWETQ